MYKFPLRISFFGRRAHRAHVDQWLQSHGGPALIAPKPRARAASAGRPVSGGGASAAGSDDEVVCTGEKTWEQRDAELRAQAVVLE